MHMRFEKQLSKLCFLKYPPGTPSGKPPFSFRDLVFFKYCVFLRLVHLLTPDTNCITTNTPKFGFGVPVQKVIISGRELYGNVAFFEPQAAWRDTPEGSYQGDRLKWTRC